MLPIAQSKLPKGDRETRFDVRRPDVADLVVLRQGAENRLKNFMAFPF